MTRDVQHVSVFLQQPSRATYGDSRALARVLIPHQPSALEPHGVPMLYYAVVFFVIALVAALFGFGGIVAGAVGIAKILFFVFLVIAVASAVMGLARRA
jgi:uncharacterized membrane protein YtjA (UPF0391 family)